MTLRDLRGHSPAASIFRCDFSYSSAAVDKMSTGIARFLCCDTELLVALCDSANDGVTSAGGKSLSRHSGTD